MTKNLHLWAIPLLPLIGAAINGLLGRRFKNAMVSAVALLFTAASFAWAAWAVWTAVAGQRHCASPHRDARHVDYGRQFLRAFRFLS